MVIWSYLVIVQGNSGSGDFGVITATHKANLAGTLNLQVIAGFTPTADDQYAVLNYGFETGNFATYTGSSSW